jgi:NADH-quinone oxidoreductase subunit A
MVWPLGFYFATVLVIVGTILLLSHVLGERHREPQTGQPYESGIATTGPAHGRFAVSFYLVALAFVVFDVEAVFLYAWAVDVRRLGLSGLTEATVFVVVLAVALAYLWRNGALDLLRPPPAGARRL